MTAIEYLVSFCSCTDENLNFLWNLSNPSTSPGVLEHLSAATLWPQGPSLVTMRTFQTPTNPCLANSLASCQLQLSFLTDNFCNWLWPWCFCLCKFPLFCSLAEHNWSSPWICFSGYTLNKFKINISLFQLDPHF